MSYTTTMALFVGIFDSLGWKDPLFTDIYYGEHAKQESFDNSNKFFTCDRSHGLTKNGRKCDIHECIIDWTHTDDQTTKNDVGGTPKIDRRSANEKWWCLEWTLRSSRKWRKFVSKEKKNRKWIGEIETTNSTKI